MIKIYAHLTAINHPKGNLGDKMGFLIAEYLIKDLKFKKLGMRQIDEVDSKTYGLVGSLIQAVSNKPINLIGAGLINSNSRKYEKNIKFHGVRGFMTKALILRDAGVDVDVISDPGLLLSDIIPKTEHRDKKPLGFIIHKVDRDRFLAEYPNYKDLIIDNYEEPETFVRQLSSYSSVVSTSLHGCVFCHSYGIPVAPFTLTDEVIGGEFKFQDYYSSLGINVNRKNFKNKRSELDFISDIIETPQPNLNLISTLKYNQKNKIREIILGE
ncbi:polysaccharide pyruvyl transferase family protein [Zobellella denitrificans]